MSTDRLTEQGAELLRQVRDEFLRVPEKLYMPRLRLTKSDYEASDWRRVTSPPICWPPCDTVACIAGEVCEIGGRRGGGAGDAFKLLTGESDPRGALGQALFGLFLRWTWWRDLASAPDPTLARAQEAARRIDAVLERFGPEASVEAGP